VLTEPVFKATKNGASLVSAKKKIAIDSGGGDATLELTNEYGNAAKYSLDTNGFDALFVELWRFVKESQH
jgi:hypothetical protein